MFKNFFIIVFNLILIFFSNAKAENINSISFIKPIEIQLNKEYLINNLDLNYINISGLYFSLNPFLNTTNTTFSYLNLKPTYQNYFSILSYYHHNKTMKNNFIELEIIPYYQILNKEWENQNKELNIRTSISYGLTIDKKDTISTFFGIVNQNKTNPYVNFNNTPFIEYGNIFFVPGIQLRSSNSIIKTFLEMPLYQYNFVSKTQSIYPINKENIRANFQIQVIH